jgi:hypothetical protein
MMDVHKKIASHAICEKIPGSVIRKKIAKHENWEKFALS